MELYGFAKQDRSARVRWLLEELDVPYEDRFLSYDRKENTSPEYLAINPMGCVPHLIDEATNMFESAAICIFLADKYAVKGLAPQVDSPKRATYLQWILFAVGTMEPIFSEMKFLDRMNEEEKSGTDEVINKVINTLESALVGRDYLLGEAFSVADIMIVDTLRWKKKMLLEKSPILKEYFERAAARPARIRAMAESP